MLCFGCLSFVSILSRYTDKDHILVSIIVVLKHLDINISLPVIGADRISHQEWTCPVCLRKDWNHFFHVDHNPHHKILTTSPLTQTPTVQGLIQHTKQTCMTTSTDSWKQRWPTEILLIFRPHRAPEDGQLVLVSQFWYLYSLCWWLETFNEALCITGS